MFSPYYTTARARQGLYTESLRRGAGGRGRRRAERADLARHQREPILLLIGDVAVFYLSLWLTLLVRHWELPSEELFDLHAAPFSILFVAWILVFVIAGLYDQHTIIFKRRVPGMILRAQITNVLLAGLFFFLIPYFGIAPKTNLAIYLGVSFLLIVLWRLHLSRIIGVRKRQNALFIGNGSEVQELIREIDGNDRYHMRAALRLAPEEVEHLDRLQEQILAVVEREGISIIVADTRDESIRALLPVIYNLIFLHASFSFVDTSKLYETIFARVPLSSLRYSWFLDSFRFGPRLMYDFLKRIFDFTVGAAAGAVMLGLLPIVWAAIRFEDGGPLFIRQERVGEGSHPMHIVKFRTMSGNDQGSSVLRSALTITRTGRFLRKTRLDELPQAWNLIRGDLSFVGPRPELPALATEYARAIPYYNARHLIKPGLTGWAQIYHEQHPHHGIDVDETKNKLSYDLYYIKNRSFLLDMQIALKTIRTILSRSGA